MVAVFGLIFSLSWLFAMGLTCPNSPLRQKLHADLHWSNSRWANPVAYGPVATPAPAPEAIPATQVRAALAQPEPVGRVQQILAHIDPARAHMWSLGARHISSTGLWRGEGAGTWARFHRSQPRPSSLYFAHMHNTYLDLAFEYGLIPLILAGLLILTGLLRLLLGRTRQPRIWMLYFAGMGIVALGQHLFFSFFSICLVIPGVLVLVQAGRPSRNRKASLNL
jgi:hypothetical protein